RRGGRSQVFRGADLRYELQLELPQAVFGHQVEIEIPRLAECEVCHGSGAAKGSQPATCDTCGGAGQVRISQGFFQLQQTCPRCRGTGSIVRNPCDTCLGQGRVRRTRKLAVKVPAGVDNGDRVRLAGEGEAGRNGGPPGDLYVEVQVREHPIFEREGEHLSCEVPVSFATAALGRAAAVPTPRRAGTGAALIMAATHRGPVRLALIGATGRMGRAVVHAVPEFPRVALAAAVASATSPGLGHDAGELAGVGSLGVPVVSDLPLALRQADVAIDFSLPAATRANLLACRAARKPLLLCTTGFTAALEEDLSAASRDVALLVAAN